MHSGIIKITFNRTATHFMENRFLKLGEEVILTLLWQSGTSESANVCFINSLSICYWLFKRRILRVMCVCVCVCERGRHGHTTVACVQTHTSFINVSVMRLRSPLGLELMVKLRTLLTVFTLILKDEDTIHFRRGLWCSSNHNALCQLANQSRPCLSERGHF